MFFDEAAAVAAETALTTTTSISVSTVLAGVAGVAASVYPVPAGEGADQLPEQCNDEDKCSQIYKKIDIAVNGLQRRYRHIRENRGNMDPSTHQDQFRERQVHLRNLLYKATSMGCFNYRQDAWYWATRPAPKPGPRTAP